MKATKGLKNWPKTELEYWQVIEAIGYSIWHIEHDLGHGRITSNPALEDTLKEHREIQEKLVSELEKFGVIRPKDCPARNVQKTTPAPAGKIWYWEWYDKMKRQSYQEEYDALICSACALNEGLDKMIQLGNLPCGPFPGSLYHLRAPFMCAMLATCDWAENRLSEAITKKGGEKAWEVFKKKRAELYEKSNQKVNKVAV